MDEILHPDLDEEDVLGVGDHLANQNENSESQVTTSYSFVTTKPV